MAHATDADVAALLARTPTPEEIAMINRRLDQVERMILRRVPDLEDQITAGDIDAQDVTDIEADAVLRVLLHGDGVVSENDGNYGFQKSYGIDGSLRVTADEWKLLGIKPSRMFQIVPRLGA